VRPPEATSKIFQPVVGGVDGIEPVAVGRQRQRAHLAALERDERSCRNAHDTGSAGDNDEGRKREGDADARALLDLPPGWSAR
jgi:hypothetical protein